MSRFNGKVSYLCIVIANKQDGSSTLSLIIGRVRLYHIISYFFPVRLSSQGSLCECPLWERGFGGDGWVRPFSVAN